MFSIELENTSGCKKNKFCKKLSENENLNKEELFKDKVATIDNNELNNNISMIPMNTTLREFKGNFKKIEGNIEIIDGVLFKKIFLEKKFYNSYEYKNNLNNINNIGNIINDINLTNRICDIDKQNINNSYVKDNHTYVYKNYDFHKNTLIKGNNNKNKEKYISINSTINSNEYLSNYLDNKSIHNYKDNIKNISHYSMRNEINKDKNLIKNKLYDLKSNIFMNIKQPNILKKKIDETYSNNNKYKNDLIYTNSNFNNLFNFYNSNYKNNLNIYISDKKGEKDENFYYKNGSHNNNILNKNIQVDIDNLKNENKIIYNYFNKKDELNFDFQEKNKMTVSDSNNENGLPVEENKDSIINYLNLEEKNNFKKMNSNSQMIIDKKIKNINDEINVNLFLSKKNKENKEDQMSYINDNFIIKKVNSENSYNINCEEKKNKISSDHNNILLFLMNQQDRYFNNSLYNNANVRNNKTELHSSINAVNLSKSEFMPYKKKKCNIFKKKKNNYRNNKMLYIDNEGKKKSFKENILYLKNKLFSFDKYNENYEQRERRNNMKNKESAVSNNNENSIVSTIKKKNSIHPINNTYGIVKNDVLLRDLKNKNYSSNKNLKKNSFIVNENCEKENERIVCKNIFCEINDNSNLLHIEKKEKSNLSLSNDIIYSPLKSYHSEKKRFSKNQTKSLESIFHVKNNSYDNKHNKEDFSHDNVSNIKTNIYLTNRDQYKAHKNKLLNYKLYSQEVFKCIESEEKTEKKENTKNEEIIEKEEKTEKEEKNEKEEKTKKEEKTEKEEKNEKEEKTEKENVKTNYITSSSESYKKNNDQICTNNYNDKKIKNTIKQNDFNKNETVKNNLLNNINNDDMLDLVKISTDQFAKRKMNNESKIYSEIYNNKNTITYNENYICNRFNKTCVENKINSSTFNLDNNISNIKNNKGIIKKNIRNTYCYLKDQNFYTVNKSFFFRKSTVDSDLNKTPNVCYYKSFKKNNENSDKKSINDFYIFENNKKKYLYFLIKKKDGKKSFNVNHNSQKLLNRININNTCKFNKNYIKSCEFNKKKLLKTLQYNTHKDSHIFLQAKSEKNLTNCFYTTDKNNYTTNNLNGSTKKKLLNDNLVDHYCVNHKNEIIFKQNIKLHNDMNDNENIEHTCRKNSLTSLYDNKEYCCAILVNKRDPLCLNNDADLNNNYMYENYEKEKYSKLSSIYISENNQKDYQYKSVNFSENSVDEHIGLFYSYKNNLLEKKGTYLDELNFKLDHKHNINNFKKYNFVNNENDLFNTKRLRSYIFKGKNIFNNKFFKVSNESNRFSFFKYFDIFTDNNKINKKDVMNEDKNEKTNVDENTSNNCEDLDKLIRNNKTKYLEKNKWESSMLEDDNDIIDNNNNYKSNNNYNSNDDFNKKDNITNDRKNIIDTNNNTGNNIICNIIIDNNDNKKVKSNINDNRIIKKEKSSIFNIKTDSNGNINDIQISKMNNLYDNINKNGNIFNDISEENNEIIKHIEEKVEKNDKSLQNFRKEGNTKIDNILDNTIENNILYKENDINHNPLEKKNEKSDINEMNLMNKEKENRQRKNDFLENKNFLLEDFEKIAEKINLVLDETVDFFKENLYVHNGYGKVKICVNNKRRLEKKKLKKWSCVYKINKIICKGAHGVVFSAWKSENINYFNRDFFEKNNSPAKKKNNSFEKKDIKIGEYYEEKNDKREGEAGDEENDDDETGDEENEEDETGDEDNEEDETENEDNKEDETENEDNEEDETENEKGEKEENNEEENESEDEKEELENRVNNIYNDEKEKKEVTLVKEEEKKNIKKEVIEKKCVEKKNNIRKSENIEETEGDNDEDDYDEENLVSLKIINLSYLSKKNNLKKILREVYFLKICNHPNIVKYYESFFWPPSYLIIVCEFLSGGTLHDLYKKYGKISEDILVYIIEDILKALNYLHNECLFSLIHRDIKPTNIVLSKNGTAKLIDFGSCERFTGKKSKEIIGTIYYIPPEILMKDNYDCSVDIWSLGITIYEVVKCSLPWKRNKNLNENIKNIINSSPKINIGDGFSKHLCYFVEKCLQKKPENRGNVTNLLNHKFLTKKRPIKKKPNSIYEIRDILKINNGKKKNNIFRNFLKNFFFFNEKNKKNKNKVSSSRSCEPEMFFQKLGKENLYFLEIKLKNENVRSLNDLNFDSSHEKEENKHSSNNIENKKENYQNVKLLENNNITKYEK
ncbi:protein kinase, putative [Plasmodium relictum]|uniref:Protein kinase, putative n=1 Tax=Plasmodium relictum TaxID=85471 RepID=A0A1J1H2B7_PLARL|nr:protein kinase, putative [Plasmodium relictum]CRG98837.1 protein kinase, putative [Plasmodium relictum]